MKQSVKMLMLSITVLALVVSCCGCGALNEPNIGAVNHPTQTNNPTQSTAPTQGSDPTQGSNPTQSGNGASGCDVCGSITDGPGASSDVRSPFAARCSIQNEFTVDDIAVSIEFSFGPIGGIGVNTNSYKEIVVFTENSDGQSFVIRQFDSKELLHSDYIVEVVICQECNRIIDFIYAHTETIDLPISMFTGDSGGVWVGFHECSHHDSEQHERGSGGGVWLYYERDEANGSIRIVKMTGND